MEFTVDKPTYDSVNKYYQLAIVSPPVFTDERGLIKGMEFEGDLKTRLNEFIDAFLQKASSSFSKPLDRTLFFQRLVHEYSTGEHEVEGIAIQRLFWIPARIIFFPNRYEIRWMLTDVEVVAPPPGTVIQEADVDDISTQDPPRRMLPIESVQRITRQRIRKTRIRLAFAKLHLEKLIEKYYRKYGNFEGLDAADSELSSEEE